LAPRTEFLTVGEAHQVAVPRGLEVQAPNRISNPAGRRSELPMESRIPRYSVQITKEGVDDGLTFSARLPHGGRQLSVRNVVPTLTSDKH
jgi:hypothetical protein